MQESLPVGSVRPACRLYRRASVATRCQHWSRGSLYSKVPSPVEGVSVSKIQCIMGNCHMVSPSFLWTGRQTDTTENITFPQLRWWLEKLQFSKLIVLTYSFEWQSIFFRMRLRTCIILIVMGDTKITTQQTKISFQSVPIYFLFAYETFFGLHFRQHHNWNWYTYIYIKR